MKMGWREQKIWLNQLQLFFGTIAYFAGEWTKRFRKKRSCYGLISGSQDGAWRKPFTDGQESGRFGDHAADGVLRLPVN